MTSTGQCLLVANYSGGSVASLPVKDDGSLEPAVSSIDHVGKGPNQSRQEKAHAHSINVCPDGHHAVAADLGTDGVTVYDLEKDHRLAVRCRPGSARPPGSGPRHFAFHPSGKFGYVCNELLSTVTAFQYDGRHGILTTLETVSTLPADFQGRQRHRGDSGASKRQVPLRLQPGPRQPGGVSDQGRWEAHHRGACEHRWQDAAKLLYSPGGEYLLAANQDSDSVVVFRIDQATDAAGDGAPDHIKPARVRAVHAAVGAWFPGSAWDREA